MRHLGMGICIKGICNGANVFKNVTDQLTKLTRVQFKSNKNMKEKMDQFAKELSNYNNKMI